MFSHLRFDIAVFWDPEEGYHCSGYSLHGEDGPFDDWDLLETAALPLEHHVKMARALGYSIPEMQRAQQRALANHGLRQRLL